tara:strand:- start:3037 stop:4017 length:981 start_codon:yes stop_codon:yes gene_type:complete
MAYSDPAGFNIICSIIDKLIEANKKTNSDFKVFTNQEGIIDKKYSPYIKVINNSLESIEDEIDKFLPEIIFTATSINNFEHLWRISSKKKKIRVESIVDHWTGIKKRFSHSNKLVYPDTIFLLNDEAKKIAISEGVPEEIIRISENPYYEKVKNFKPKISRMAFFNHIKIKPEKKIILYVSDKIKYSPITSDLGFDELSIFENVLQSLGSIQIESKNRLDGFILLVKLHPRENEKKYLHYISKNENINIKLIKHIDPLLINYFSDIVIGSFSNMIIESYLLNKSLFRVQIGLKGEDPLKYSNLKEKFISSQIELNKKLKTEIFKTI